MHPIVHQLAHQAVRLLAHQAALQAALLVAHQILITVLVMILKPLVILHLVHPLQALLMNIVVVKMIQAVALVQVLVPALLALPHQDADVEVEVIYSILYMVKTRALQAVQVKVLVQAHLQVRLHQVQVADVEEAMEVICLIVYSVRIVLPQAQAVHQALVLVLLVHHPHLLTMIHVLVLQTTNYMPTQLLGLVHQLQQKHQPLQTRPLQLQPKVTVGVRKVLAKLI